eukprot:g3539.t1
MVDARRALVIGAGPSGLVALKTLRERGYDAKCFEMGQSVGGTFVSKSYDGLGLVSSRFITAFSDFRFPPEAGDHPTVARYLEYLEDYCMQNDLNQHIYFKRKICRIDEGGVSGSSYGRKRYAVTWMHVGEGQEGSLNSDVFDAVCVCSGLHNVPSIPHIDGLRRNGSDTEGNIFEGVVIHSSEYKDRSVFAKDGTRVLIVGTGETGLDIAYRAARSCAQHEPVDGRESVVTLVSRSGFLSVPTVWGKGIPLDTFITNLFECCYVHRWVEYLKLKWRFTTPFIRLGFLFATGSSNGFNQWAGTVKCAKRGYYIINKSVAAMPYINKAPKRRHWLGRFYQWLDGKRAAEDNARIDVISATPVRARGGKSIEFSDGSVRDFDLVIFATGYKQHFPFLDARSRAHTASCRGDDSVERLGISRATDDPLPNEHQICWTDDPNLGFIGFVRPNVGAIPPMSELQVMWWISRMEGILRAPAGSLRSYRLLGLTPRTNSYGVDYGAYMHDLAREAGAAPDLWRLLLESPRAALAYALGQSYITFFRLHGPYAWKHALSVASKELYSPVRSRPIGANLAFIAIIAIFGVVNAMAWSLEKILRSVGLLASRAASDERAKKVGERRAIRQKKQT